MLKYSEDYKAMKLVSSAKLTRTRQLSEQARSYAVKINRST